MVGYSITVRRARPEDVPDAARVHTVSSDAAYAGLVAPSGPEALARREASWRDALERPDVSPFVAESERKIIGVMMIGPARDEADCGELYVLYVHPDWWGSGAAQLLIDHAHEQLQGDHHEAVLTVLSANARARRFYERNGWVLDQIRVEPHLGGQATEVARYRRKL
jgi:RimJ/RimL family protein N-acetyltransferase